MLRALSIAVFVVSVVLGAFGLVCSLYMPQCPRTATLCTSLVGFLGGSIIAFIDRASPETRLRWRAFLSARKRPPILPVCFGDLACQQAPPVEAQPVGLELVKDEMAPSKVDTLNPFEDQRGGLLDSTDVESGNEVTNNSVEDGLKVITEQGSGIEDASTDGATHESRRDSEEANVQPVLPVQSGGAVGYEVWPAESLDSVEDKGARSGEDTLKSGEDQPGSIEETPDVIMGQDSGNEADTPALLQGTRHGLRRRFHPPPSETNVNSQPRRFPGRSFWGPFAAPPPGPTAKQGDTVTIYDGSRVGRLVTGPYCAANGQVVCDIALDGRIEAVPFACVRPTYPSWRRPFF